MIKAAMFDDVLFLKSGALELDTPAADAIGAHSLQTLRPPVTSAGAEVDSMGHNDDSPSRCQQHLPIFLP